MEIALRSYPLLGKKKSNFWWWSQRHHRGRNTTYSTTFKQLKMWKEVSQHLQLSLTELLELLSLTCKIRMYVYGKYVHEHTTCIPKLKLFYLKFYLVSSSESFVLKMIESSIRLLNLATEFYPGNHILIFQLI